MWLNGRSPHTVRAYGKDAEAFLEHAEKPLRAVTVGDIQAFGASLAKLASATQARRLSSVKSLLTYAHRLGYIPFNTGAAVLLPAIEGTLAQRIMEEHEVHRMIALETDLQARELLRLLYAAGAGSPRRLAYAGAT